MTHGRKDDERGSGGELAAGEREPRVSSTRLYDSGRMPNVVTTTRGTVLATWGRERVRVRRSEDAGETWVDPAYDETIPDGPRYRGAEGRGANYNGHFGMMAGLARLPVEREDVLLYSTADVESHRRRNLTVWASFDGGRTWPVKRRVHDGVGAYSSLAPGRPGTASEGWCYMLFEDGEPGGPGEEAGPRIDYAGGTLARFTLEWLVRGERTGDGDLPDWIAP